LPIANCRLTSAERREGAMTTDELKARTKEFALRVIRLVDALPNSVKGRAIANQITRSSTSVDSKIRTKMQIEPLLKEAGELVAIMAASRKSAIGNRKLAIH